jgi:cysteine desulfurase
VIDLLNSKIGKLRELSPLWDMYKEGIDLSTIQWAAHCIAQRAAQT